MGLLDTFIQSVKDLNPEWTKDRLKTAGGLLADFTPVVGDVKSAYDGVQAAKKGDYLGAGLGALGALPLVPNLAGMFIGKGAKTWDAVMASKALEMEKAGADPRAIWKETGNWKGPDGKWRQEIPDNAATINKPFPQKGQLFGDVYDSVWPKIARDTGDLDAVKVGTMLKHDAASKAYPEVSKLSLGPIEGKGASYIRQSSIDPAFILMGREMPMYEAKSNVLHEMQHAIQQQEGWAKGGSVKEFDYGPMFNSDAKSLTADLGEVLTGSVSARPWEITSAMKYADIDTVQPILKKYGFENTQDALDFIAKEDARRTPFGQYQRLAGEAESRATQSRMNLDANQRRALFPADSYDVPIDQLIIRGLLQ